MRVSFISKTTILPGPFDRYKVTFDISQSGFENLHLFICLNFNQNYNSIIFLSTSSIFLSLMSSFIISVYEIIST